MSHFTKPEKKKLEYYDYYECCDYINKKYKCNIDDYGRMFQRNKKYYTDDCGEAAYQCFWDWVLKHHEINNGGLFQFSQCDLDLYFGDEIEDWQEEIYQRFLDEFAENGKIQFMVSW